MELHYETVKRNDLIHIDSLVAAQYLELPNDFVCMTETHQCWEVNFIDYGQIYLFVDGEEKLLQKQNLIIYPPMVEHGILEPTAHTPNLCSVAFESDSPLLYKLANRIIRLPAEQQKNFSDILKYAYRISDHALPVNRLTTIGIEQSEEKELLTQMIILSLENALLQLYMMLEHPSRSSNGSLKTTFENQMQHLVMNVEDYIDNHIGEKLLAATLSRQFHVSEGKLCRNVKQATGHTLQELIALKRLKAAKHMIRHNESNFSEIAEQLGFSSLHYFSQWFKLHTHMSPTEYATSVKIRSQE